MTATHRPFKSAALGYHNILNYMKNNTTAENPTTVEKVYAALKDEVKNVQQVRDAVKRFRTQRLVASVREGRELAMWWIGGDNLRVIKPEHTTVTTVTKSEILTTPVTHHKDVNMPEVQITKDNISILAGGVKITIARY